MRRCSNLFYSNDDRETLYICENCIISSVMKLIKFEYSGIQYKQTMDLSHQKLKIVRHMFLLR